MLSWTLGLFELSPHASVVSEEVDAQWAANGEQLRARRIVAVRVDRVRTVRVGAVWHAVVIVFVSELQNNFIFFKSSFKPNQFKYFLIKITTVQIRTRLYGTWNGTGTTLGRDQNKTLKGTFCLSPVQVPSQLLTTQF